MLGYFLLPFLAFSCLISMNKSSTSSCWGIWRIWRSSNSRRYLFIIFPWDYFCPLAHWFSKNLLKYRSEPALKTRKGIFCRSCGASFSTVSVRNYSIYWYWWDQKRVWFRDYHSLESLHVSRYGILSFKCEFSSAVKK